MVGRSGPRSIRRRISSSRKRYTSGTSPTDQIARQSFNRWHSSTAREQEWIMKITSINPATGEAIKTYDEATPEEVASAVAQAHEAWQSWRTTIFADRAVLMKETARILHERKVDLARLMAAEMGKPLKQGIAEVEKCARGGS